MTTQHPALRTLLLVTLLLAIAGDSLLRVEPWGLNAPVVMLLLVAGIGIVSRAMRDPLPPEAWIIAGLGVLTATCIAWRDAGELTAFDLLATIAAIHLVTARKRPGEIMHMTFVDHLVHVFTQAVHLAAGGFLLLLRDLRPGDSEGSGGGSIDRARLGRIGLGIALTIPAILVFGALLTSADATFEYLITDILRIDIWTLIGHAALIAFLAWLAGGWMRARFLATEFFSSPLHFQSRVSLGMTELAILLGSLDLLFGIFVVIQIPHFFGGHTAILDTPALTYAQYARRGFFELIAVAALGLPLLLMVDWLYRGTVARERRIIRTLSAVMIAFLGVMLASAMHRLFVYMEAYGLTTARINASAILIWIGLALVLFCILVFRGKRQLLPFGIIVSGYIVLLGLNAVNPDALVARVNMTRMATDGKFDTQYTFRLGADAVPVLLDGMTALTPEQRSLLAERLLRSHTDSASTADLRSWNSARAAAYDLVSRREAELKGYIIPAPAQNPPAAADPAVNNPVVGNPAVSSPAR